MDKIREEFDLWLEKYCVTECDDRNGTCMIDKCVNQSDFISFAAGYKSRDKEIRELKAFKKIYYPMLESGNIVREQLKAEIKKLKDVLKYVLETIEDTDVWWLDCPDKGGFDVDRIKQILKESE